MNDLIEFITARLAEDEAKARAADVKQGDPEWWASPVLAAPGNFTVRSRRDNRPIARIQTLDGDEGDPAAILDGASAAEHIALHDPARALREVASKRRLVDFWSVAYRHPADDPGPGFDRVRANARWTLVQLALPYADHPDWREEWAA